jgi:large subunit ribosomal protein L17
MMMRTLVTHLIRHEQIKTTVAKAKEARRHADKMITLMRKNTRMHNQKAHRFLLDKTVFSNLRKLAERFADRQGGYTRIIKAGYRKGDNAPMALLEYLQPGHISVHKHLKALRAAKQSPTPATATPTQAQ